MNFPSRVMIFALVVSLVRATGGWSSADGLEGVASFRVSVVHSTSLGGDASSSTDICGEYGVLTAIEHVSWPTRDSSLVPLVALFRPFHLTYSVINGGSATADGDNDPIATPLAVISPAADQIGTINATRQLPRIVLTEPQNEGPAHEAIAAAISARRAKANTDGRALWGQQGDAASGDECGSVGVSAYMSTVLLAHAIHRAWLGVEAMGLTHAHVTPQHVAHEINQHEVIHTTHGLTGMLVAHDETDNTYSLIHQQHHAMEYEGDEDMPTNLIESRMLTDESSMSTEPLRHLQSFSGGISAGKKAVGTRFTFVFGSTTLYWIALRASNMLRKDAPISQLRVYRKPDFPNKGKGHWAFMEKKMTGDNLNWLGSSINVVKSAPQMYWRPSFHVEVTAADGAFARGVIKAREDVGKTIVTDIVPQPIPNCARMFTDYKCPGDCAKVIKGTVGSASGCQTRCQRNEDGFPCRHWKWNFESKQCTLFKGNGNKIILQQSPSAGSFIYGPKHCRIGCYTPFTKMPGKNLMKDKTIEKHVLSATLCQEECLYTPGCKAFTFWFDRRPKADRLKKKADKSTTVCELYNDDQGAEIIDSSKREYNSMGPSVSGSPKCPDFACLKTGRALSGKNLPQTKYGKGEVRAGSLEECLGICMRHRQCQFFQYDGGMKKGGVNCFLKGDKGKETPSKNSRLTWAPAICMGEKDMARCAKRDSFYEQAGEFLRLSYITTPAECALTCFNDVECYFWYWTSDITEKEPCRLVGRQSKLQSNPQQSLHSLIAGPKNCNYPDPNPPANKVHFCQRHVRGKYVDYKTGICCPMECPDQCNKCGANDNPECCSFKIWAGHRYGMTRNNICEQDGHAPCKFLERQMTWEPWCGLGKCAVVPKRAQLFTPAKGSGKDTLRFLAEKRQLKIGTAISYWLRRQKELMDIIKEQYTVTVAKSECKPGSLLRYNWRPCDYLMDEAEKNDQLFKLHAVAWYRDEPMVIRGKNPKEKDEWLFKFTEQYIKRYLPRKAAYHFDLANEALEDGQVSDGTTWIERKGTWMVNIPNWMPRLFAKARQVADSLKKPIINVYNDYGILHEDGGKGRAVYAMAKWLMKHPMGMYKGRPTIDVIGCQTHIDIAWDKFDAARAQMRKIGSLGLEIAITEMDVGCGKWVPGQGYKPCGQNFDFEKDYIQSQVFATIMRICLEEPNCTSFTVWGTYDPTNWLNTQFKGEDHPTLIGRGWKKKLAFFELQKALSI
uniref:endo-1,4-beta-xylanase n=1 Tax=Vitrella brassicaformis TaxID=1169539 RepID=A0A7S1JU71_9ALVE|mmetsp:Transcript_25061/g.62015  ORF Transcript_25061/g.62015 Transcript_25061/m.62015 type:complete len:1235 (+) Transcript_25061:214-3918(+)